MSSFDRSLDRMHDPRLFTGEQNTKPGRWSDGKLYLLLWLVQQVRKVVAGQ